jgi:serine phosphatase RsbU (regulator of sigma subunit)
VSVLEPTAPLIGVFDDQHHLYRQRSLQIENGTLLVATTDGVTEARGGDGELFGMDRFIAAVTGSCKQSPKAILARVIEDVQAFSNEGLRDDIAIVAVRFA